MNLDGAENCMNCTGIFSFPTGEIEYKWRKLDRKVSKFNFLRAELEMTTKAMTTVVSLRRFLGNTKVYIFAICIMAARKDSFNKSSHIVPLNSKEMALFLE